MVTFHPQALAALTLAPLALWFFSRWFDPQRPHGRILARCVAGVLMLALWNAVLPLRLGVNPLSAWLTGSLGLPGLGLMAVLALMN